MRRPVVPAIAIHRFGIWLPILLPAVVLLLRSTIAPGTGPLTQLLVGSLVWGGIPYCALALWATWRIGHSNEQDIRRLMLRAPLLMAGLFVPLALILGLVFRAFIPFAGLAGFGLLLILMLGYAYVGIVMLLVRMLGSPTSPVETD